MPMSKNQYAGNSVIPELAHHMPGTLSELAQRSGKNVSNIHRTLKRYLHNGDYNRDSEGVYRWVAPLPFTNSGVHEMPAWFTKVIENWDLVNTELTTKEDITQWLSENAKTIILGCKYMDLSYKLKQAEES
jgi:hypothetical protein